MLDVFVYVATGEVYAAEACRSADSLRSAHPTAKIVLLTDSPPAGSGAFNEVLRPQGPIEHTPIDKLLAYEVADDRVVFLDTDTHVTDDLSPMFEVLERFDIAVLQDVNRGWNYQLPRVPLTFSEFNTGVIAFRRNARVERFFQDWREEYNRLRKDPGFVSDQPSFRSTLYKSDLRVAPLPSEFHFLANYPNAALWKARLLHGRGDYVEMERLANETLGLRAYVPELGVITKFQGRKKLVGEVFRFVRRALRLTIAGSKHPQAKHPTGWNRNEPG